VLGRLTREADVRNDERELVAVAPHRQHHAEITEGAVDGESHRPLRRLGLIAQDFGSDQEIREKQAEQETECRR
jgi:hypothetical protein